MKPIRRMIYKELDEFMQKNRLQEITFRNEAKIRRELDGQLILCKEDGLEIPYECVTELLI